MLDIDKELELCRQWLWKLRGEIDMKTVRNKDASVILTAIIERVQDVAGRKLDLLDEALAQAEEEAQSGCGTCGLADPAMHPCDERGTLNVCNDEYHAAPLE